MWRVQGFDRQICNDQEKEDEKCCYSLGPSITDLADKTTDHDGKDDASDAGATRGHTICYSSIVVEPSSYTANC